MNGLQREFGLARKPWINVVTKGALISVGFGLYVFVESGTRDQLSRMEDRIERVEDRIERVEDRIERVEDRIGRVEDKIDRVETKIDEVRGYLRFNAGVPDDAPPEGLMK